MLKFVIAIALAGAAATWFATQHFSLKEHQHIDAKTGEVERQGIIKRLDRLEEKVDRLIERVWER